MTEETNQSSLGFSHSAELKLETPKCCKKTFYVLTTNVAHYKMKNIYFPLVLLAKTIHIGDTYKHSFLVKLRLPIHTKYLRFLLLEVKVHNKNTLKLAKVTMVTFYRWSSETLVLFTQSSSDLAPRLENNTKEITNSSSTLTMWLYFILFPEPRSEVKIVAQEIVCILIHHHHYLYLII